MPKHTLENSARLSTIATVLATASLPTAALAEITPEATEVAFKQFKKTGEASSQLTKVLAMQMANRKEDCTKPLQLIAIDNLSKDHRSLISPGSFVDGLSFVDTYKGVKSIFQRLSTGTDDLEQAKFMLHLNFGAAIRYRSEWCEAKTLDATQSSASPATQVAVQNGTSPNPLAASEPISPASAASPASTSSPSIGANVVGIDGWEGEIVGNVVQGGKFEKLKIGMTISQAIVGLGLPDDQRFLATTKSLIPVNFGSDKWRLEHAYKGLGRLTFSSAQGAAFTEMHLIKVVHNPNDPGQL